MIFKNIIYYPKFNVYHINLDIIYSIPTFHKLERKKKVTIYNEKMEKVRFDTKCGIKIRVN